MAHLSTYSFLDVTGAIAHPSLGAYTFTGEGAGDITISMAGDKTVHDVANDGKIMVSKIAGDNGQMSVSCQQTSNLHKWLLAWYNYLRYSDSERMGQDGGDAAQYLGWDESYHHGDQSPESSGQTLFQTGPNGHMGTHGCGYPESDSVID